MKTVDFHDYKINISIAEHEQDKEFINSIYTLANNDELVIKEKGMPYVYSRIKLDGHKLLITNICSISFSCEEKELCFKLHKAAPIEHSCYEKDKNRKRYVFYNTAKFENRITRNYQKFSLDLPSSIGNLYTNSSLNVLFNEGMGVLFIVDKVGTREFITNKQISTYIIEGNTLKVDFIVPHLIKTAESYSEIPANSRLTVNSFIQNKYLELGKNMQIRSNNIGNEAILLQDINDDIRELYVGTIKYNQLTSSHIIQEYYYSALSIKNETITLYGNNIYPKGYFDLFFSSDTKAMKSIYKKIVSKDFRFIEDSDCIKVVSPNNPEKIFAKIFIKDKNEILIFIYECLLKISRDNIVFIKN